MSRTARITVLLLAVCAVTAAVWLSIRRNTSPHPSVVVGKTKFSVEIAGNDRQKARGLSGRESLPDGTGMLFVFSEPTMPSFWMKDMRFALDFIWIRENRVIQLTERVPYPQKPDDAFPSYQPLQEIDHVLEVPAGTIEKNRIAVGDPVKIE